MQAIKYIPLTYTTNISLFRSCYLDKLRTLYLSGIIHSTLSGNFYLFDHENNVLKESKANSDHTTFIAQMFHFVVQNTLQKTE